jgi:hypothetical protein
VAHYNTDFFGALGAALGHRHMTLMMQERGGENLQDVVSIYIKTQDRPFISFDEFSALPGLQSTYADYRVLDVSFEVKDVDGRPLKFGFKVDTDVMTSVVGADTYCRQAFLSVLTVLPDETEDARLQRCVDFIARVIDAHRIESNIRS